jgi:hypothetical protein
MKILDADTSLEGKLYTLTDDGIYSRAKVSSIDYQHMHPNKRPEFEWKRIDAPEGIIKIIVGVQSELFCIANGHFTAVFVIAGIWQSKNKFGKW